MNLRISIFGLGYVGTVSLGCLSREGHRVIGVDIDPTKRDLIRQGLPPIIEDGMKELIAEAVAGTSVEVTDDGTYAIHNSDISFVCVGTPSNSNGSQDLSAIKRLSIHFGNAMRSKSDYHVFVVRSTVVPGTVEDIIKPIIEKHSGKKIGEHFGLCFQPEFMREGSSIKDFNNPPYTIVGGDSERSVEMVRKVFGHLPCEFISTPIRIAEMLKYANNTFHALKMTFANEIGRVCQAFGVESYELMELVCCDTHLNISSAYMKPGFAFGGSCLPKDLKALLYVAKSKDVRVPMLSHVLPSNTLHIHHAIDMVIEKGRRSVGMIGLSFKSGTDDLRESPMVLMAEHFIGKGMELMIYDPLVSVSRLIGANRRYIEESIPHIASLMCDRVEDLIERSQVLVVGLQDKLLLDKLYAMCRKDHFVLDLVGIADREKILGQYRGVCW